MSSYRDALGVEILPTDTVLVSSYGYGVRLVDCGTRSRVLSFTPSRIRIFDADHAPRTVSPCTLSVLRRDGAAGLQGNA